MKTMTIMDKASDVLNSRWWIGSLLTGPLLVLAYCSVPTAILVLFSLKSLVVEALVVALLGFAIIGLNRVWWHGYREEDKTKVKVKRKKANHLKIVK